ncbi:MAG: hypothetical protein ACYC4L_20285 [Chloroflexota bacterium]
MSESERARLDSLLDLLVDEVSSRIEARRGTTPPEPRLAEAAPLVETDSAVDLAAALPDEKPSGPTLVASDHAGLDSSAPPASPVESDDFPPQMPEPAPSRAASLLLRLALGVLAIVAVVNVPLGAEGAALARSIPSSASLIIRDGLVVKETSSPEFWLYREGAFHWISSLDAFEASGYRWSDVHVVEDGFLRRYQTGRPLYLLLKCGASPHVYRLEEGSKRWVTDLATFHAEGHRWEEVRYRDCGYLRALPDGESIPPGRGTPPPPLP